jgi:carotenoid cleavage dioxygenase
MTAHPKLDPETGEMLFFGYSPLPPYLRYHVADANGRVTRSVEIDVHVPTMMHDFIATRNHVIFMVLPAVFQLDKVAEGGSPLAWRPEVGARIGVMPRNGGNADVRWFDVEPCYVFHPMNAYEDGERIVADVCRYERLPLFESGEAVDGMQDLSAKLTRWTMDLAGGALKEERLDDSPSEFPRLDERFAGLQYRHGYAAGIVKRGDEKLAGMNAIMHYDLRTGRRAQHLLPASDAAGEPIFVPRKADSPEGEGFLLSVVYRGEEKRSDVVVLDAQNVSGAPLAIAKLPHRVPFGFHGNWGPDV